MKRIACAGIAFFLMTVFAYGKATKAKIIGQNTVMRSLPSTTSESCMRLEYGDTVTIAERGPIENIDGNICYWYKVFRKGKSGWAYGRDILIKGSLLENVFGRWRNYHGLKDTITIIWPTVDIREDGGVEFYYDLMWDNVFVHDVNKLQYCLTTELLHNKFFHFSILPLLKGLKWKYNAVEEILLVELPSMPERPETMLLFNNMDRLRDSGRSIEAGIDFDFKKRCMSIYLNQLQHKINGRNFYYFSIAGWVYNKDKN